MKQEIPAGIIFCLMGLSFLIASPDQLWSITEKWKTKDGGQPSKRYAVLMRILGIVFAGTGAALILCSL